MPWKKKVKRNRAVNPDFLTTTDAARILGASPNFVRKIYDQGKLTGYLIGKERRISRVSLNDYISRTSQSSEETINDE